MAGSASDIVVGAANICCDNIDLGFTDGGIKWRYTPEFLDLKADQAFGTIGKRKTDEKMFIEFELISVTLANIRRAMALPAGNLVDSCLLLGYSQTACDAEVVCELKMVGPGPNCCSRTYWFPLATPSEGFEVSLSRTEAQKLSVTYEILKTDDGYFGLVCDSCPDLAGDPVIDSCDDVGVFTVAAGVVTIVPPGVNVSPTEEE